MTQKLVVDELLKMIERLQNQNKMLNDSLQKSTKKVLEYREKLVLTECLLKQLEKKK